CKPLADTSNLQEEVVKKLVPPKSDSLVSSAPVAKKRSISKVLDVSADIPLRSDGQYLKFMCGMLAPSIKILLRTIQFWECVSRAPNFLFECVFAHMNITNFVA